MVREWCHRICREKKNRQQGRSLMCRIYGSCFTSFARCCRMIRREESTIYQEDWIAREVETNET